jgi:hypothetical protein
LYAKSGEKEARDGGVERWDLPVLIFCGRAKVTLGGAKAVSGGKNAIRGIKKDGGWYILNPAGEYKMEIPA